MLSSTPSPLRNTLKTRLRSVEPRTLATTLEAAPSDHPIPIDITQIRPIDRNIKNVVLGDIQFKTWYPSFYPEELVGRETERLYVCRWCFKYSRELMPYLAHVGLCSLKEEDPPGRLIYTRNGYSIYEVDGDEHKLFTQNLSLFAKLFLDNKSVFYDVNSFLYYLLVQTNTTTTTTTTSSTTTSIPPPPLIYNNQQPTQTQNQVIGFFSKEKMSWDNNNLACILVFPPWQRKGMGKILMGVSYELSKHEGRVGGPEKPLSTLGKRGYLSFWSHLLARHILSLSTKSILSITSLSLATYMLPEDIITTLKAMEVLGPSNKKSGDASSLTVSKSKVRDWAVSNGVDLTPSVEEEGFVERWSSAVLGDEE